MSKIKLSIIGVGNCASSLVQGLFYYKNNASDESMALTHTILGEYHISDIEVVSAIDIDSRKVGKPLGKALKAPPNCTKTFYELEEHLGPVVTMGKLLDGCSQHLKDYSEEVRFELSSDKEAEAEDIIALWKQSHTDVVINLLPVGSELASEFYAECAIDAKVAFVNAIPVFLASSTKWAEKFRHAHLPILGDDIKAQMGATIIHRVLVDLFKKRGVTLDRTYQLNTGGNSDFLNMLNRDRLYSKKASKTEAVQSVSSNRLDDENIHIGPSDYIPWLKDNKIAHIRIEGRLFGDVPMTLDLKLSVEDSPNSAGILIDAIRCAKIALDRNLSGPITEPSAFYFKHPPLQYPDDEAYRLTQDFIKL